MCRLIQTASGALNQITSILQTMNQLALSSANGATNDTGSLNANEQEFVALQNQIDQIADTTSYGTKALLDGTFSNQSLQVGAFDNSNQQLVLTIGAATTGALGGVLHGGECGLPGQCPGGRVRPSRPPSRAWPPSKPTWVPPRTSWPWSWPT